MAVRATMQDLILRVRDRIGDNPAVLASRVWTDQQIQDALDRERLDVSVSDWRELTPRYSVVAGSWAWTKFFDPSNYGNWEVFDSATDDGLYSGGLQLLTPATSDYQIGKWTFAVNTAPPVFIVGRTYDVAGSAAIIVQEWLGLVALQFDFSAMRGTSFNVSQKRDGLQQLLEVLRQEQRVRTARLVRSDVYGAISY